MFLGGVLEVPSNLLTWPMMEFVGRKRSIVLLFFLCAVCIFSVMVVMLLEPHGKLIQLTSCTEAWWRFRAVSLQYSPMHVGDVHLLPVSTSSSLAFNRIKKAAEVRRLKACKWPDCVPYCCTQCHSIDKSLHWHIWQSYTHAVTSVSFQWWSV